MKATFRGRVSDRLASVPIAFAIAAVIMFGAAAIHAQPYFVSTSGDDANTGTLDRPVATLERAVELSRLTPGDIWLRAGTYSLARPIEILPEHSGSPERPRVIGAHAGERVVISGGVRLDGLQWRPVGAGIVAAEVPAELRTEELFVNGERQVLARYPNFDPKAQYFGGFAADAISTNRSARWSDPRGGYYHAMHPHLWGDFTWRITGKNPAGAVTLEGGWQNNRGAAEHKTIRFVENIREELDAPGEWFLDVANRTLLFHPPAGVVPATAVFEATRLATLVRFAGSRSKPVRSVILKGLTFRHAARTVMQTREPLLRSDWAIHRGGALFLKGTEDCVIEDCHLDQVGGNAIFANHYHRRLAIRGVHIDRAGASGICFVGDPAAARNPLFHYEQVQPLEALDRTPGPMTPDYPAACLVDDCLIHETGRVEKQTAGILIDLSQGIRVRHCSIYDVPRAGINIGDGC